MLSPHYSKRKTSSIKMNLRVNSVSKNLPKGHKRASGISNCYGASPPDPYLNGKGMGREAIEGKEK
jgi:hypothetical protein